MNKLSFLPPKSVEPKLPLFVYVPGMDGSGGLFQNQAKRLESAFDLRCLSIPSEDLSSWEQLTKELICLIKQELTQNGQRSVYLCGESFGGCLSMMVALYAPSLIQRLILVNPATSFNQSPWLGWGGKLINWLPEIIHQYSAVGFLPFLTELSRIAQSDRRALLQAMKSLPQKIVSWRLGLLQEFPIKEKDLYCITQPTLLVAGAADRLLPSVAEAQRLIKLLPQATMTILPYSGHACLIETETDIYQIMQENSFFDS